MKYMLTMTAATLFFLTRSAMALPFSGPFTYGQLTPCVTLNTSRFVEKFRITGVTREGFSTGVFSFSAYKCGTLLPHEYGFQAGPTQVNGREYSTLKRFIRSGRVRFRIIASGDWTLSRERKRKRMR